MEASEIVIKTLQKAGKPMKAGEIAEMAGMDKAEVDKVIKKLKKEDKIQSPKNCYYEVK
jgi:DNA-binding transcriptional regulator GbsR (MarR family)